MAAADLDAIAASLKTHMLMVSEVVCWLQTWLLAVLWLKGAVDGDRHEPRPRRRWAGGEESGDPMHVFFYGERRSMRLRSVANMLHKWSLGSNSKARPLEASEFPHNM